ESLRRGSPKKALAAEAARDRVSLLRALDGTCKSAASEGSRGSQTHCNLDPLHLDSDWKRDRRRGADGRLLVAQCKGTSALRRRSTQADGDLTTFPGDMSSPCASGLCERLSQAGGRQGARSSGLQS